MPLAFFFKLASIDWSLSQGGDAKPISQSSSHVSSFAQCKVVKHRLNRPETGEGRGQVRARKGIGLVAAMLWISFLPSQAWYTYPGPLGLASAKELKNRPSRAVKAYTRTREQMLPDVEESSRTWNCPMGCSTCLVCAAALPPVEFGRIGRLIIIICIGIVCC